MTKGKKRAREETEDPNPRSAKRQNTDENLEKLDEEFAQINDECVKKAIIRINKRLFANLDVLNKIQKDVEDRDRNSNKNNNIIDNIFNNVNAPSDAQSRDDESGSEKSAGGSKTKKKRVKQAKNPGPNDVQIRYPKGKKFTFTPRVHKMPPVDSIPNGIAWAAVPKNYPAADNRERAFMHYFSDEEDRDQSDLDALYDKRFLMLEDHDSDNILEGYIQKFGTRDQNQILPAEKMQYLADAMECDTPENLKQYLVLKTNYVSLYCQNNSSKRYDLREFDTTLSSFFCRRCYLTYCPYHSIDADYHHFNMNEKNSVVTDQVNKPCGEHCFANSKNDNKTNSSSSKDVWTERDLIAFNKARIKFTTPCQIHTVMRTKTCKQIYDMLVQKDFLNKGSAKDVINVNYYDEHSRQPAKKKLTRINRSRKDGQFDASYSPCSHPGFNCEEANCQCFVNGTYCEKFCSCSKDCERKFTGCNCSSTSKTTCIKGSNTGCLCAQEMRECDPDICRCKCDCYNALALMEKQKKVSVRKSKVAGWGLFADTKIKEGEFVAEYRGDLVSSEESDRRGLIYDAKEISFLFGLHDSGYVVDATRKGNKMKFANHSSNPNVDSCIESTLGELRIVMRAARDIEPDEELFINYGYSKKYFKRVGEKSKAKSSRKKGMKKASLKETPKDNSDDNSTSEAQKKKKSIYRNEEDEQEDEGQKELPVIKMPPRRRVMVASKTTSLQSSGDHVINDQSNDGKSGTTSQNGSHQKESNPNPNKNAKSGQHNINDVNINNTNQSTTVQVSARKHYNDNNAENRNEQDSVSNNVNSNNNATAAKPTKSNTNVSNNNQRNNERRSSLEESQEISCCDDSRSVTNTDVASVRSNHNSRTLDVSEDTIARKIKQRKINAPRLHYKTGPPVVDLDSEHHAIVARKEEVPVCLSSGEEEPVNDNGVVDVENQDVEYMGKFVDVHSIDSD